MNDQQIQNFIKIAYEDQKILQEAYSQIDIEINDEFVDKIEINQSNLESDLSELNDEEAGFPIESDQTYLDFTSTSDKNLISKIRKAIAQINKSSFNKEIFSNLTEESSELEFKRLNIHSDVVTRWDSLFTMLKDFDKMHNCIECALMKIYSNERSSKKRSSIEILTFEEPELCRIKELIQILDPIHNAIAELSKKDTNLFVAELSIELMLNILLMIKQSSSSLKIYNELKDQLEKRRTILSDIAIILYDPKSAIYKYGHFERPPREKLIKAMIKIIKLQDQNIENIDQQLIDDSEFDELFQDPPAQSNKKRKFCQVKERSWPP